MLNKYEVKKQKPSAWLVVICVPGKVSVLVAHSIAQQKQTKASSKKGGKQSTGKSHFMGLRVSQDVPG